MEQQEILIRSAVLSTGVSLEYTLTGPSYAPVLCFIHGLGSNLRQFLPQQAYFEQHYRVLLVSLRGHGESTAPEKPTTDDFTLWMLAQDVQALLDHLGIASLHIVGNSLGGLVAYELLRLNQAKILSLTTFGTTAELHSSRLIYWTVVSTIRVLGTRRMAALVGRTATKDRNVGAQLRTYYESASRDALILIAGHIADYDYTALLRRTSIPLLLIQGTLDHEINAQLDTTLAALREHQHNVVARLEEAGHFANMEQPAAFNQLIAEFLADARILQAV
jgi:pimeloyl-ACP methyl ester carboxylesterase